VLLVPAVAVLVRKHELLALQSAVVMANRVGVLSATGGTEQSKLLIDNDLGGWPKRAPGLLLYLA
jgi:hypothetical protein